MGIDLFGRNVRAVRTSTADVEEEKDEGRLEGAVEAQAGIEPAGEADLAGQRAADAANQAEADLAKGYAQYYAELSRQEFEKSNEASETGLEGIQDQIATDRELIATIPGEVKAAFDTAQTKLDEGLDTARTGIAGQASSALANVMTGQSSAMEAAVSSIQGSLNQQISAIDSQVQQGTLSPSQATAMKAKIKMGGTMQLSAAVGQTIHMFTETQAQVATSFGEMFTQFESTAAQVQGAFGATAAGAFADAQTSMAQMNVALTNTDAMAVASRDSIQSNNAASRGVFENTNNVNGMAMLDYTQDLYVMETPIAINEFASSMELAGALIKSDQFEPMMDALRASGKAAADNDFWQTVIEGAKFFFGG